MKQWMMPNDFQPKLGHRFTFRRPPIPQLNFDGISHCEVTVLELPERLEFTFVGGGLDTVVRFRLVPQGRGRTCSSSTPASTPTTRRRSSRSRT